MVSLYKEDNHVIEDKRKAKAQKADTCWSQKRYMPPMSLLLRREIVVVCCFVWLLALRLWSGRQMKIKVLKINIELSVSVFFAFNTEYEVRYSKVIP